MKLRILDQSGHTETEITDTDAMIAALEKEMNSGRKAVIVEEPEKEPVYLRSPADAAGLHPDSVLTVMPQLRGG